MLDEVKKNGGDRKVDLANTIYYLYNVYIIVVNSI